MCQSDAQQHERRDDEDNSLRVSLDFATLRYIGGNEKGAKARETQRLKIAVCAVCLSIAARYGRVIRRNRACLANHEATIRVC